MWVFIKLKSTSESNWHSYRYHLLTYQLVSHSYSLSSSPIQCTYHTVSYCTDTLVTIASRPDPFQCVPHSQYMSRYLRLLNSIVDVLCKKYSYKYIYIKIHIDCYLYVLSYIYIVHLSHYTKLYYENVNFITDFCTK